MNVGPGVHLISQTRMRLLYLPTELMRIALPSLCVGACRAYAYRATGPEPRLPSQSSYQPAARCGTKSAIAYALSGTDVAYAAMGIGLRGALY
eukprot:3677811-Rhodomonas_salina.1